jgi:hypothetical protein
MCDIIGNGDVQGRWISVGVRTDNVTLVRRDFSVEAVYAILDYLVEFGEGIREIKITRGTRDSVDDWKKIKEI